jgi:hypothetical protein
MEVEFMDEEIYRKAFQRKKGESDASMKERMEKRIIELRKSGFFTKKIASRS